MKYKLIKLLPFENSPRIGYISQPHLYQKDEDHYWNGLWFNPENYPEFWEKVKDYEILSLARLCSIKPTITDTSDYGDGYIEALLKCDKARVHSVKRNDGEIFTIGDKTNFGLISKIVINNNSLSFYFEQKSCGYNLQTLIKWKPLFTTEQRSEIEEIIKNIIK